MKSTYPVLFSSCSMRLNIRSLYPKCGIIWCSDLDFSLHAFRMRIEYFFMKPVEEQKIKEGLSIWFERRNVI